MGPAVHAGLSRLDQACTKCPTGLTGIILLEWNFTDSIQSRRVR